MKSDSPARATLIVTGLFMGGMLAGTLAANQAVARAQDPYASLDVFVKVLNVIEEDYVDEVEEEKLIDAAITGMVSELDAQSRWLSADQFQNLQDETEGTTTGIGIEFEKGKNGFQVTNVLQGSPALRDGVEAGDRILEINGKALADLDNDDVVQRFNGPRGEETVLTILRDGWSEPREVRTVHDKIHVPSVESALIEGSLAYVRLVQFQEGSGREVRVAFENMADDAGGIAKIDGLILDLRDNPGGLLTEAVAVSDLFLHEGTIVSTRARGSIGAAVSDEHVATSEGLPPDLRVVCVVNGMSASASEIVAGALQDTGRGVLVGETTYGKGTVQQLYKHVQPDRAALKLTIGTYYTPSGEPVAAHEGRPPDHEVLYPRRRTVVEELKKRIGDVELSEEDRASLQEVADKIVVPAPGPLPIPWETPASERFPNDPQLQKAAEILRS